MKKEDIINKITEVMQKAHDERQNSPHQFVVAYFRVKDDTLIGYHLSTFCQTTQDILEAKRYANEDPYPQLKIISKNLHYTLSHTHIGEFAELHNVIKENDFHNLKPEEVYMDAIYLAEGTPKQNFKYTVINPETE